MTLDELPLLVRADEAAAALRTTVEVVKQLVDDGRLPVVRLLPGEPPLFRPTDLLDLVEGASA